MTDKITPEHRSWNMARIKGKDTKIEVRVRSCLFKYGYRFRKNDKRLPGKPDIVLPKHKTVIFIHGCFWHQHKNCKLATVPKTRTDFWIQKFEKNINNDKLHEIQLIEKGWKVITIWECELKNNFDEVIRYIIEKIETKV